jgi:hypothetical protein
MYVHVGIGTVWAIVNGSFPGFNEYAYEWRICHFLSALPNNRTQVAFDFFLDDKTHIFLSQNCAGPILQSTFPFFAYFWRKKNFLWFKKQWYGLYMKYNKNIDQFIGPGLLRNGLQDRFNEAWFRPKSFCANFYPWILNECSSKKLQTNLYN